MRGKLAAVISLVLIYSSLSLIPSAVALDIPGGLAATGNRGGDYNEGSVTVSWNAVTGADNGYAIQTLLNGVQVGSLTGAIGQSTVSAVVSGLQGGSTYSFKIRAISSSAVSSWSSAVTAMPTTSPQYTLHDESHFLRVVEIMAMVLGETVDQLNSIELCLLILTAYYHDLGMVMTEVEYSNLSSDSKFQLFRENWYVDYPNQKEIQEQLQSTEITDAERTRLAGLLSELEAAMLTDYLRETHAKRSYDYVIYTFSTDKRLEIYGINLSSILAKLCESHYSHTHTLTPANGYLYDQQIGLAKINEPFIAIVLRLADILDFDADRTPDVLFRTIHFSSGISLCEWEKHRAITGWEINEHMVRYTAEYVHPAYQAAAFKFMDWIDKELSECQNLCRAFPAEFDN
jgi:hypothetical protein